MDGYKFFGVQEAAHRSTSSNPHWLRWVPRTATPELESKWHEACDQAQAATQAKRALVPEAMCEAARVKVSKLEAAIETTVQFLRQVLARATVAAVPLPVDLQLTQCQQFIDRATNAECHDDHTMSLPCMLLRKPRGAGRVRKDDLFAGLRNFPKDGG